MTTNFSSKRGHKFLYFCIFLLFLLSMDLWIGWQGRWILISYAVSLVMFSIIINEHVKFVFNKRNVLSSIVLSFSYLYFYPSVSRFFCYCIPVSVIILLNYKDRVLCLRYITKWFAFLMIPSLITYFLVETIGLSSFGKLVYSETQIKADWYMLRENYLFYTDLVLMDSIRFCGPFNEPGHLGMMSAFLLFANGFDLRKKTSLVILLSIFFSFSLSGYLLAFFGYLFTKVEKGEMKIKFILMFITFVTIFLFVGLLYNGGDNAINELILSRLEPDEEKGITGNNRVGEIIHLYFASMFGNTKLLLFGYGDETMEWLAMNGGRGTGLERWMVHYGIVGVLLSIIFYVAYFLFSKKKKLVLFSLLFVLLMLLQRSYYYWFSWIICFVYGTTFREFEKINCKKDKYENKNNLCSYKQQR